MGKGHLFTALSETYYTLMLNSSKEIMQKLFTGFVQLLLLASPFTCIYFPN